MSGLLDKLAAICAEWKKQYYPRPGIPLEWIVDDAGMLWLDGVWICPADQVDLARLGDELVVTPVSMEINTVDGYLTVIISDLNGTRKITGVERLIRGRKK